MILGHLVPHNGSPIDWFLWTNSSQPILSQWTNCPNKSGLHGKMVTNQFGPHRQMVPRIFHLSGGGDRLWESGSMGIELVGDHLPKWTKFFGTICLGGLILWGSFVQWDRKWGTGSLGIKWVWDKEGCNWGHGLSAAIKLRTPEPKFLKSGCRLSCSQ